MDKIIVVVAKPGEAAVASEIDNTLEADGEGEEIGFNQRQGEVVRRWVDTLRKQGAGKGAFVMATTVGQARQAFIAVCREVGSDHIAEETAILSIGDEFLPACALAVRDASRRGEDGATVEYYAWLVSQTLTAQSEHEAAGHGSTRS